MAIRNVRFAACDEIGSGFQSWLTGNSIKHFHAARVSLITSFMVCGRLAGSFESMWRINSANSVVTSRPAASNGGGALRRCLFNSSSVLAPVNGGLPATNSCIMQASP